MILEILLELAKRLGFTLGNPTYRTYEEYLEDRLSPTGLTLDELKEHGMMPQNILCQPEQQRIS